MGRRRGMRVENYEGLGGAGHDRGKEGKQLGKKCSPIGSSDGEKTSGRSRGSSILRRKIERTWAGGTQFREKAASLRRGR